MNLFTPSRRQFLTLAGATAAALSLPANAQGTAPPSLAPVYPLSGQPDDWTAFRSYDPATDPSAAFFRSHVPRARRITPFAATQAHPALRPDIPAGSLVAAYLTLAGPDIDFNRTRYLIGTQSRVHVERAWQYQDVVVAWNTTGLVPNASLIDAVHRNGALCLGTMFQPDKCMFDGSDLSRPEVAARLIKLATWFGFDGYFVNFEGFTPEDARGIQDLIEEMQKCATIAGLTDFHVQYYDGYTDVRSVWPGPAHADGTPRSSDAPRANSMMIDQGWSNYGLTHGCCSGPALATLADPAVTGGGYTQTDVYYGLQLYPGPGYFGLMAPIVITPNGGPASGGLQIYSVEDGLRKMRRARVDQLKASTGLSPHDKDELATLTDPARTRTSWYDQHRRFWSGQSGNPAAGNSPTPAQLAIYGPADIHKIYTDYEAPGKPTDQLRLPITYGVANFIAERSVIGAYPFISRFNTGEGDRFFLDGAQVAQTPWFDLGIQDILPTWAWWTKPLHPSPSNGALLKVDYDFTTAWNGGASLCISGQADATEIKLYKTHLPVTPDVTLGLVFKTQGRTAIKLGLVFEDAPGITEWIDVKAKRPATGWQPWQQSLAKYQGRILATLSLGVDPVGAACRVHIGEVSLTTATDAKTNVAQPQAFRITQSRIAGDGQSAQLRLNWTFDPAVSYYNIFAGNGATRTWLGRITGDAWYVAALSRAGKVTTTTLSLVPVTRDGLALTAMAANLAFDWGT